MKVCLCCGNKNPYKTELINDYRINCAATEECVTIGSEFIEVDELLADILVLLNQSGLKTIHSCEGHYFGGNNLKFFGKEGYITFEQDYDDQVWDKLKDIIPDEIGDFIFTCENLKGPRDILDLTIINKCVIRWVLNENVILSHAFDYHKRKLKLLTEVYKLLNTKL